MTDRSTVPRAATPAAEQQPGPSDVRMFSPAAVAASCAGFVLIGALQALYGPSLPAFRTDFRLSPAAAGLGLAPYAYAGVGLFISLTLGAVSALCVAATHWLIRATRPPQD